MDNMITMPVRADMVDATIRATVRGLMKDKGLTVEEVAPQLGSAPSTLHRKLSGEGVFKAADVAGLAVILKVSIKQLYSGTLRKSQTPNQRLASMLLEQDVLEWIKERRAEGCSWRLSARLLHEATDGVIDVTYETLRGWAA